MRISIIGCGGIAHAHAKDLLALRERGYDIEIPFLVDVNKEKALKLKEKLRLEETKIVEDYKRILNKTDAVIVCTPHTLHYEHIINSLKKDVSVLVEKPMVCRLEQAYEVIEEAERRDLVLEIGFQRHFIPCFIATRDYIREGRLGDIRVISMILGQRWYRNFKGTWRHTLSLGGGGELIDSGSHFLDVAFWTTGLKPVKVYALVNKYDTEVDINTGLVAELSNGAILNFTVAGDDPSWYELEIFWGDEGRLILEPPKVKMLKREGEEECTLDTSKYCSSRPVFNFVDVLLGKDVNKSPPIYGLYVIATAEAAYKSCELNRPVSIKELCKEKGLDYYKYFP